MSVERSSEPCPKCGQLYIIGEASCSSCGLVFAKWEQKQQGSNVVGSQRMELAWQDLLNRWNEELVHRKFIDQCYREHNLPFASLKYRRVLEADPHSEVAQRMQKRLQEMVITSIMSVSAAPSEKVYSNRPIYVLLMMSAVMILLGLNMPGKYMSTGMPLVAVGLAAFIAVQMLKRFLF